MSHHKSMSTLSSMSLHKPTLSKEVQLIGDILQFEDEETPPALKPPTIPEHEDNLEQYRKIFNRPGSAPPAMSHEFTRQQPQMPIVINGELISPDDPRLSPAYYAYYHSHRPLDPRLPPPLFNWSSIQYAGPTPMPYGAESFIPNMNSPPDHGIKNESIVSDNSEQKSVYNVHNLSGQMSSMNMNHGPIYSNRASPLPSPSRSPVGHAPTCPHYGASIKLLAPYCNCGAATSITTGHRGSISPLTPVPETQVMHSSADDARKRDFEPVTHHRKPSLRTSQTASKVIASSFTEVLTTPGMLLEYAVDQHGSRFIQQHLESLSDVDRTSLVETVAPETVRLCMDVFGNYVIQKLLEYSSPVQRMLMVQKIKGNVLTLTLQMYGCRVIQKVLEVMPQKEQSLILDELIGHVRQCVMDQNGNHVIQKAIERISAAQIQFIVDDFKGQILQLGKHPYGCRVIQRLLEQCKDYQKSAILEEIQTGCLELVQDQYGNYVIQHVLEHGTPRHRSPIIASVIANIVNLAKHKFASNVVESSFIFATDEEKKALVNHVINSVVDGTAPIALMVRDQYANYVVQRIIDVSQGAIRMSFIDGLKEKVPNLRKVSYGKHIISRIEKITGKPF